MISPEKVIIIIALLFIICVMPFPIGLLMFKFKSEKLKAEVRKKSEEASMDNKDNKENNDYNINKDNKINNNPDRTVRGSLMVSIESVWYTQNK